MTGRPAARRRWGAPIAAIALLSAAISVVAPAEASPAVEGAAERTASQRAEPQWAGSFTSRIHLVSDHGSGESGSTTTVMSGTVSPSPNGVGSVAQVTITSHVQPSPPSPQCDLSLPEPVSFTAEARVGPSMGDGAQGQSLWLVPLAPTPVALSAPCLGGPPVTRTIPQMIDDCGSRGQENDGQVFLGIIRDNGRYAGSTSLTCTWPSTAQFWPGVATIDSTVDLTLASTVEPPPPGGADLVAGVQGLSSRTHVGKIDMVTATVQNRGPGAAANVVLRFGTPRGTEYGYVRSPGSGWTCSVTAKRFIACTAASLAAGATARLTASLFAAQPREAETKLAVRVSSATEDPVPGNNEVVDHQRIRDAVEPPPPGKGNVSKVRSFDLGTVFASRRSSRAAGRDTPWFNVSKYGLYIKATGISYIEPQASQYEIQGYYAATLWGYEEGHSRVIRIELENKLRADVRGQSYYALRGELACKIPDDSLSYKCGMAKQFTVQPADQVQWMQGTWKFIRKGFSKNVKITKSLNK